jgi:hypothetical protein
MEEVRTRVIYDYGRWDFETELKDYADESAPIPTDEEWVKIQAGIQHAINESAWEIIRDSMLLFLNSRNFNINHSKEN